MSRFSLANRKKCERRIAQEAIIGLLNAGYAISVYDGEEFVLDRSRDCTTILEKMFTTDEDRLFVHTKVGAQYRKATSGWVYFIYGNEGPDVINDHTVNLEAALKGANDLADRLEEEGL